MNRYDMTYRHFGDHPFVALIEAEEAFEITRHGEPVAVCLPIDEYERLVGLATMQAVR